VAVPLLNDRDLQFLLYELLDVRRFLARERYAHHSVETLNEVLDTARVVAEKHFANHYTKGDSEIPVFENGGVTQLGETKMAWNAFASAGFFAAKYDFENGGIQLPEPVFRAALSYFCAANIATTGYMLLTAAAIELLRTFGDSDQQTRFMRPMMTGRFSGTMAMTEPQQGSSLADIRTEADRADDGTYRIRGQKIFISGGDQSITENVVHLVLARIRGAQMGTKGLSLFICPKFLVESDGTLGLRNDVQLIGLLHKMGYHNTTSAMLAFGERGGAIGYLVAEEHQGLKYMFQMMHEARIAVGTGAATLAYQGFNYSLGYARERIQGRLPSSSNPKCPQVRIIEHADVRRMLLAQKACAEGALALCLFAASLREDAMTGEDRVSQEAHALLDLLTPVVKSWPSKHGVRSNDLSIQVLGGAGYTRAHPLEQYYRDQRLNPIHEGVEAIHALDLLKRRVRAEGRYGFEIFVKAVRTDAQHAGDRDALTGLAGPVLNAVDELVETTESLARSIDSDVDRGLANATLYLDVFGQVAVAWIWLRQATCALRSLESRSSCAEEREFYLGKLQAARYFIEWELPSVGPQTQLLRTENAVCFEMKDAWF
jgi:butyryl-CoA dehydrogenase